MPEPANILVVDDESNLCWALEMALQSEGYCIATASTSEEALALVRQKHFHVGLVDAKLPDVDGLELAESLKRLDGDIRIVVISGFFYRQDEAIRHCLEIGTCDAFVSKPFDVAEVRAVVRQLLQGS